MTKLIEPKSIHSRSYLSSRMGDSAAEVEKNPMENNFQLI